jgi:DNA-binding NarL/FixJ family response regulator
MPEKTFSQAFIRSPVVRPRERQILVRYTSGENPKQIASEICMNVKTVRHRIAELGRMNEAFQLNAKEF